MSHRKQWQQLKSLEKRKASKPLTHATRAWRLQRGNTLASPEKSPRVCLRQSIIHRSNMAPSRPHTQTDSLLLGGRSRDHIAMRGTSATIGQDEQHGADYYWIESGYDVVEEGFGGGRARVVGAGRLNSSCQGA